MLQNFRNRLYLDTVNPSQFPYKEEALGLMSTLNTWAASADLTEASLTPVKWRIFWHRFRGSRTELTTLDVGRHMYQVPYRHNYYWPDVRDENGLPYGAMEDVREALIDAVNYTVLGCSNLSAAFRLNQMVVVRIPFVDNGEYGVTASDWCLKVTGFRKWLTEPSEQTVPKMEVRFMGFLPMLVRFAADGSPGERKVWVMSYNVVSDNLALPEWSTPPLLDRYKAAIARSAAGTLTDLKLNETDLQGMYSFQVYFNPPWQK